MQLNSIQE